MTLREFIEQLQEIEKQEGSDIEVYIQSQDDSDEATYPQARTFFMNKFAHNFFYNECRMDNSFKGKKVIEIY